MCSPLSSSNLRIVLFQVSLGLNPSLTVDKNSAATIVDVITILVESSSTFLRKCNGCDEEPPCWPTCFNKARFLRLKPAEHCLQISALRIPTIARRNSTFVTKSGDELCSAIAGCKRGKFARSLSKSGRICCSQKVSYWKVFLSLYLRTQSCLYLRYIASQPFMHQFSHFTRALGDLLTIPRIM